MKQRLQMVFDGWASQYENMPTWRPRVVENDGKIYLDNMFLCNADAVVEAVTITVETVSIYWDEGVSIIGINWAFDSEPQLESIVFTPVF